LLENRGWPSGAEPREAYSRMQIVQVSLAAAWPIEYLTNTRQVSYALKIVVIKQKSETF